MCIIVQGQVDQEQPAKGMTMLSCLRTSETGSDLRRWQYLRKMFIHKLFVIDCVNKIAQIVSAVDIQVA